MAVAYAENYLHKETEALLSVNRQSPSWKKPPGGWFKLNSDGAFHKENKCGGWGYVIRDDQGQVLKAGARSEGFLLSALHAEALGCAAGIQEASRLGIENLCIETDASLLKAALESDDYRLSKIGGIVTEMKVQLATDLSSRIITVCNRVCNRVAHSLAALGCKFPSRQYATWEGVPHELEALVISDLANANE
jgi:ribonuclease HI